MKNEVHIIRYGGGRRSYDFENVESGTTNFGGVNTSTSRIPGMDGVFDNYGLSDAPSEGGDVPVQFHIALEDREKHLMTRRRDAVSAIKRWGRRPLWGQPYDLEQPRRWASARGNNINMAESARKGTEWLQAVRINFQVPDSKWHSRPNQQLTLGQFVLDGSAVLVDQAQVYLDDGEILGQFALAIPRCTAFVTNGTEINLTNMGNAPASAKVTLMASRPWTLYEGLHFGEPGVMIGGYGSASVYRPGVARLNDWGDAVERWRWNNTLSINEKLVVDAQASRVQWQHYPNFRESGYPDFNELAGDGFIRMEPGQNILRVEGEFDGPFGFLIVDFDDSWY